MSVDLVPPGGETDERGRLTVEEGVDTTFASPEQNAAVAVTHEITPDATIQTLVTPAASDPRRRATSGWRGVFVTGLLLWVASVVVTGFTRNLTMIPTVVLLGSFLVPATAVIWYVDHYRSPELTGALVVRAFIIGGVLGVLAASVLESWLIQTGWAMYFGVGLIEEGVKLLALIFVARGLAQRTIRDGIVLGAAVGFGFAALESSGYALSALLVIQNGHPISLSLAGLVTTEVLRAVLAPLGHGLWTGILGGVLFAENPTGRWHPTWKLLATYLLISLLHGLFDSMSDIASLVSGGSGVAATLVFLGLLTVVSVFAYFILRRLWRSQTVNDLPDEVLPAAANP